MFVTPLLGCIGPLSKRADLGKTAGVLGFNMRLPLAGLSWMSPLVELPLLDPYMGIFLNLGGMPCSDGDPFFS